ncbi:hypothetical protein BDF19DRAFT_413806 [Syncephalis fuscata]|nr:hypothetical protein BDF19DRAFT_413806 [Syncephalis fuscata]
MIRVTTRHWSRCIPTVPIEGRYLLAGQYRSESTTASSNDTSKPDYKHGRYGYVPGFNPPPKSSRAPEPPKPDRQLADLPTPSKQKRSKGEAAQQRAAMTGLRHQYARDVLTAEIDRKQASLERQERELARVQAAKRKHAAIHRKHGRNHATTTTTMSNDKSNDAFSPEKLFAEPQGIFSPISGMPLRQPKRIDIDTSEERRANYLARSSELSRQRSDALVELFHRSADFVTEANLEAKIDGFFNNPEKPYARTLTDLLSHYRDSSNSIDDVQGKERLDELKRVLDGVSIDGKIGVEGIEEWKANQQQQQQLTNEQESN